jgi:hypothetical protein
MSWWKKIMIFVAAAVPFAWLEWGANFADPDAYYHAKMAALMLESGPVFSFAWLPFTTLVGHFADQAFLYHLWLVPFAAAFGPFVGVKVAAGTAAAGLVLTLALCLRAWGGRHAPWLAALVFASGTLTFRLALPKPGPLAVALLLVVLTLLRGRRAWPLAALAFAYVWLHGSWPLALAAVGVKLVVDRTRVSLRQTVAVVAGLAAGLVINPYFPGNLAFYWEQIVQVAVVGYGAAVNVGQEWDSYPLPALLAENGGLLVALLATLAFGGYAKAAGFWRARRGDDANRRGIVFLAFFTALLLAMTLRQRRHLEFLAPTAILLLGALWGRYADAIDFRALKTDLAKIVRWPKPVAAALAVYLLAVFCYLAGSGLTAAAKINRLPRNDWSVAAGATSWLREHAGLNETVFHDDWSDFPKLFYFAPSLRGLAGLDPVFMYRRDAAAYRLWRDLAEGRVAGPAAAAQAAFGTRYLLVSADNTALLSRLKTEGLTASYADESFQVFARH